MTVRITKMTAADAMEIQRQASQRVQLGIDRTMSIEEAEDLAAGPGEAWTARHVARAGGDPRIIACLGLRETFPGAQAVAWAILGDGIGAAHLAVTRFARRRIIDSPLRRIEAIVREEMPAECTWARLVGLSARCVLPCFGALSEPHVLYDRVRGV